MRDWERIFDDLAAQGFSLGYSRAIEAFVGEVWIADAWKDGIVLWAKPAVGWPCYKQWMDLRWRHTSPDRFSFYDVDKLRSVSGVE